MKMKCKVVWQTTDKPTILYREESGSFTSYKHPQRPTGKGQGLHLYFVSDEEIKVGDYYTIYDSMSIHKAGGMNQQWYNEMCKKVVATTDSSLNLPLIPQDFIEKYVEVNGKIEEVEIKVVKVYGKFIPVQKYSTNEVIISQPEKTWTRDEVEALIMKYSTEHYFHHCTEFLSDDENPEGYHANHVNKWIQANLK